MVSEWNSDEVLKEWNSFESLIILNIYLNIVFADCKNFLYQQRYHPKVNSKATPENVQFQGQYEKKKTEISFYTDVREEETEKWPSRDLERLKVAKRLPSDENSQTANPGRETLFFYSSLRATKPAFRLFIVSTRV